MVKRKLKNRNLIDSKWQKCIYIWGVTPSSFPKIDHFHVMSLNNIHNEKKIPPTNRRLYYSKMSIQLHLCMKRNIFYGREKKNVFCKRGINPSVRRIRYFVGRLMEWKWAHRMIPKEYFNLIHFYADYSRKTYEFQMNARTNRKGRPFVWSYRIESLKMCESAIQHSFEEVKKNEKLFKASLYYGFHASFNLISLNRFGVY